nr:glycosyltransferase [Flavobacterium sp. TAB 87]
MLVFLYGILILYSFVILWLAHGFKKVPVYKFDFAETPKTTFTIVVPFRNETQNLPLLLESISRLNYPTELFEVILVDDDSDEKFQYFNSTFHIRIINTTRTSNSPKKDAISTAISHVKTDWILTTDADCLVPKHWLATFDSFIREHNVEMIAAPVNYQNTSSFLAHFQQLDLMSLQGATIGSFGIGKGFMCNGANFAYTKSFFESLKGFAGNTKIASGDDVFLLQKAIEESPQKVAYLKSKLAIVLTQPTSFWHELFFQRVRWAAKTGSYQSLFGKSLGLLVFAVNLSFILGFVFLLCGIWSFLTFELFVVLKFAIDFILLYTTNRFLGNVRMSNWLLSSLWYPFFSVAVALYSLFGTYEWKGRRFKY